MLPAVRFVRWTVLGSILIGAVVSVVLAGRSPSSAQSFSSLFGGGTTATKWGPLSPSDRDMLIKVRQVNLWEGPASEQAAQRASSPVVREVGRKLAAEHAQLDADLLVVAGKLGLELPSQPSDAQKTWMAQISSATGANYDRTYVNLARSAHGEVMPVAEGVRSGTQNELVRQFAIEASQFVGRHMDYLESTGLVDYTRLAPSTAPTARLSSIGRYNVPITLVLFLIAAGVGAALLRGLGRSRRPATASGPAAGPARSGWWARAAAGAAGAAGAARTRALRSARERREFKERMVTTAELIAVLSPHTDTDTDQQAPSRRMHTTAESGSGESGSGDPEPERPTPRRAGRARPEAYSGTAVIPVQRSEPPGEAAQQPDAEPAEQAGRPEPTGRSVRPVRPGRSRRAAPADHRPPKLGKGRVGRGW